MKKYTINGLILFGLIALLSACNSSEKSEVNQEEMTTPKTLNREEIAPQYKWDFTHIYADWKAWQKDFDRIKVQTEELQKFKGQLKENGVYVYFINATFLDGTTIQKKGDLTLMR